MISLKMALVIVAAFAAGSFFTPPVQQAIAAVIATDVQCTGCVGTSDIAGNAVTSAKIKDGEVKAAEIATDAVGGAELQGVTKLLFGRCVLTNEKATTEVSSGSVIPVTCNINGVDGDDSAIATRNDGIGCFGIQTVQTGPGNVVVTLLNDCDSPAIVGSGATIGIIVFDK